MQVLSTTRRVLITAICAALLCLTSPIPREAVAFEAAGNAEADSHAAHDDGLPWGVGTDLVLWSIVTFAVFLFVLKKLAWGPIIEGLDKREEKYHRLLADAEADRDKALKLLADYEQKLKAARAEVDEIIAEARRDAEHTKSDIIATAQREASATRQRALDDIGRAKDQAVAELFSHMRANVVAAAERVLARTLTDSDHQRLVDEALAEVSSR